MDKTSDCLRKDIIKLITQKLHENWTMKKTGANQSFPAKVPGSVYNDLLLNAQMEDPFWRDNENDAFNRMECDYEYTCRFDTESGLLDCDRVLLRCEGLDTIADLTLNGKPVGFADNMHRTWEFDVQSVLKHRENCLHILFHSPNRDIREKYALCETKGSNECTPGFPQLRKAHYMFGWDWGPRLPDAGIWRNIMLCGIQSARIESVFVRQKHQPGSVTLNLDVQIQRTGTGAELSYRVVLTDPNGAKEELKDSPESIIVREPQLWWPNGYGSQPLYTVEVCLFEGGRQIDSWKRRIGLRTLTVRREKDADGESFAHVVNGVAIFAMGADYIPEDNLLSRISRERTRELLQQCKAANFNCIRVWGGGRYPDDSFYDTCDELGLIVWQDFMFACAAYELTQEFEDSIIHEIEDNVKRIRHHASLGLWCANNELEIFTDMGTWISSAKQKADYIRIFEYIVPKALKKYDPDTFFWPSSPSSGGGFDHPNDPTRGDVHYWEVWHGCKPFTDYRNYQFRYLSEFGFQSFPLLKTVESFTEKQDRNIFSYVMEKHQRNNAANGKIMSYLSETFLYPHDFGVLLYSSQLLQAEAIKYGVEHFRRNRGVCMGTIYWQLNDCWPVASWSSIDYFGRWKALHYYARRFFAPVLLSCCEEGMLTQNTNANALPFGLEKSIALNVANETRTRQKVLIKWSLRNHMAEVLQSGEEWVSVPELSSLWLEKISFPEADPFEHYVSYEAWNEKGERISGSTVLFSMPKFYHYADPKLTYTVENDEIVVTAQAYAKSVEILNENEDLILSDNYFDMNADTVRVKIIKGEPKGIRLRSVYDIR